MNKSIIIVGDFNTPYPVTDRLDTHTKKKNK